MADRVPLIVNESTSKIQELQSGDNLSLGGSDLISVRDINSSGILTVPTAFIQNLVGDTATFNIVNSGISTIGVLSVFSASITNLNAGITSFSGNSNFTQVTTGILTVTGPSNIVDLTVRNIFSSGIITAVSAYFSGNVTVGGTLTYEDVTNIDSVGLVTARSGINVGQPGASTVVINENGSATFNGSVTSPTFNGNLTGNVTGNLTGNVTGSTGNFTGSVTSPTFNGNLTGNVTGNLTGNVTGSTGNFTGSVTSPTFNGNLTGNVTGNATTSTTAQNLTRSINPGIGLSGGGILTSDVTLTLLPPTSTNIGGVKAGSNISIASDGTISAIGGGSVGTITQVIAGSGLTGGGSSGAVTLDVGQGDGISVSADSISVDSTVVRTAGNQTIDGTKTFTSSITSPTFNGNLTGNVNGNIVGTAATFTTGTFNGSVSATSFNTPSDISLKNNISELTDALGMLTQLNPVSWNWKDTNEKAYGLIAQDLEEIMPELVNSSASNKAINYINLIGVLIKAIQELNEKISK